MPFTFSHPAAAVPLARFRLPLSALVVGSMSPDFLYFLLLSTQPKFGHTLPGLFLFCLPAGLAVLFIYHRVIKRPALDLLPARLRARLAPASGVFCFGPPRRLAVICAAILLGAITHIVWDSFTSSDALGVRLIPGLAEPALVIDQWVIHGHRVVQHVSTLVGGLLLTFWTVRYLRRQNGAPPPPTRLAPWHRAVIAVTLIAVVTAAAWRFGNRQGDLSGPGWLVEAWLQGFAVASIPFLFAGIVVFGAAWRLLPERDHHPPHGHAHPPPPGRPAGGPPGRRG
jgi:hypothetical protein